MAFIPTPNGLKAFLHMDLDVGPVGMTFWAFTPDPTDPVQRSNLASKLNNWVYTYLKTNVSSVVSFTGVEVSDQSSATGGVTNLPFSPVIFGTLTNNVLPGNTAFVTTLQTSGRGRSLRGRSFLPGLTEAQTFDPRNWTATTVADIQAAYVGLLALVNVAGQFLAVASHRTGGAPRTAGVLTPVQTVRANARIGSQRRRVPR